MQRWVLHIDMDAFFASCEQLTRPTLIGRPVLVGGMSGRGVVAGASYEARKYGARSAMPMYRAQQLIGAKAVVVRPRFEVYRLASQRVFHYLQQRVDLIEQLSIDEGYMEPAELVGASAEEVEAWAHQIRAEILTGGIGACPSVLLEWRALGVKKACTMKTVWSPVSLMQPVPTCRWRAP